MKYLIFVFFYSVSMMSFAQSFDFNQYPAKPYTGKRAAIQFTPETYTFRTVFSALSKQPANFAGHYAIDEVGCGGGCSRGMLYDLKTGKTQFLPYRYLSQCYSEKHGFVDYTIEYQLNSRLLKVIGGEFQDPCLIRYYLEENGKLKLISQQNYWN